MAHPAIRRALAALLPAGLGAVAAALPLLPAAADTPADTPAGKGAQVYCFMRGAGNNHEVSWTAAYSLIKRQSASLFKTSPEHAAVMITEAVVQNPGTFPDCGRYLGSLFERAATPPEAAASPAAGSTPSTQGSGPTRIPTSGVTRNDRYNY
ncbi:DUF6554 family protein [Vulcanococcus limneticus]|uniref:DUF6554 family protein n=1 Tax=Vulcanococcus limneticus TaxID=2170428 RepID=UPI00398BC1B6